METVNIRQELIDRLVQFNKKNKFLLSADIERVDWASLKDDIGQNFEKLKKSAKVSEVLAYVMMTIIAVVSLIKLLYGNVGPDLNKAALFIFLTVTNMFSAFSCRIRIEKIEKQLLILDILEKK